jgi:hypothetical protein
MRFRLLFANPLWGHHSPLRLGWSDDQLAGIVWLLAPWFADLSMEMQFAIAAVARSLVVEEKISGAGVHYSRRTNTYPTKGRYHDGDPRNTWYYVTGAMDHLDDAGLIHHEVGDWSLRRQSTAWAAGDLVVLIGGLCDISEARAIHQAAVVETVVLRQRGSDDEDGRKLPLDYVDTPETIKWRDEMARIQAVLDVQVIVHLGKRMAIPLLRRIFNGDFNRGGRLYCLGPSWQNIRSTARRALKQVIDGEPHPMIELDYSEMHIRMCYAELGVVPPEGDLYTIDGYNRRLVKLAVNIMFNAVSKPSALVALGKALHDDDALREAQGLDRGYGRFAYQSFSSTLVKAIEAHHGAIASTFNSDCGAGFQRVDSDMAVAVMNRMIERTGRCPLPVHDSFLVTDIDEHDLRKVMTEVAEDRGLNLTLKEKRPDELTLVTSPTIFKAQPHRLATPLTPSIPSIPTPTLNTNPITHSVWDKHSLICSYGEMGNAPESPPDAVQKPSPTAVDPPLPRDRGGTPTGRSP